MGAQKARNFLLKIEDPASAGSFLTLGGISSNSFQLSDPSTDVTTMEDEGVQQLESGFDIFSASISGEFTFKGDYAFNSLITVFHMRRDWKFQVIHIDDGKNWTSMMSIETLDWKGAAKGSWTGSIAMKSSGEVIYSPAA